MPSAAFLTKSMATVGGGNIEWMSWAVSDECGWVDRSERRADQGARGRRQAVQLIYSSGASRAPPERPPSSCSSSLRQWDGQWAAHTSIPPSPHRPYAHGIMHALANTRLPPPPLLHPTPTLRSWPLWQQWKLQARSQQASLLELPLPHPASARIGEAVPPPPTSPGLTSCCKPPLVVAGPRTGS